MKKACRICKETKVIKDFNKLLVSKDGYDYICRDCQKIRKKEYYLKNKNKINEKRRKLSKSCSFELKNKINEYNRKRYHSRLDIQLYKKQYAVNYRRKLNGEKKENYNLQRRKYNYQRKIKKQNGTFTNEEWKNLCEQFNYKCLRCKQEKPLTVDHIIPLSKNGSNNIDNIQPLCRSCNSKKGNKEINYKVSFAGVIKNA